MTALLHPHHLLVVTSSSSLSAPDTDLRSSTGSQALLSCNGKKATITLPELFTLNEEDDYRWYLQDFAPKQPFEALRAARVAQSLARYGFSLSQTLIDADVLPQHGSLSIHIEADSSTHAGSNLHRVYWELLEDPSKWAGMHRFQDVTVIRTVPLLPVPSISLDHSSTFNILLVTCRPGGRKDIDPQLVSRSLVSTVNQAAVEANALTVRLTILRPPTWLALREHLCEAGHYQLVHFDMHGEILDSDTPHPR